MPGADTWQVDMQQRDECWHCGQHILTVFFWSPGASKLAANYDEDMIKFYKSTIEKETGDDLSSKVEQPVLRGAFTNWQGLEMCEVV